MAATVTKKVPSFALVGFFASGKDTFADELKAQIEREFGIEVYRPSFSAKISEIARDLFEMKEKDRRLLQDIGSKLNEIDSAVWAKYLVRKALEKGELPMVVDGLRTPEEVVPFREKIPGFIIIRLKVDELKRLEAYKAKYGRYPTQEELTNITERTIADVPYDLPLRNNYDKTELQSQVREIVEAIRTDTLPELLRRKTEEDANPSPSPVSP